MKHVFQISGIIIADFLLDLNDSFSIPLENIQIIGHSLGGQVAGSIGKQLLAEKQTSVSKITALDPAGPLFTDLNRLTENDADVVEVIHTNSLLGYFGKTGTADFYPNGGLLVQPGCEGHEDNESKLTEKQ